MKRLLRGIIRLVLMISGLLVTFNLPFIFGIGNDTIRISFQTFWQFFEVDVLNLLNLNDPNYFAFFKVLPIAETYQYTMTLLAGSLLVVIFLGMLAAVAVMTSPQKVRNRLKVGINFFEAVPDLLVIFLFQFFTIVLFKATGIRIFQLYGIFGAKPYFIPIVTVSFLPFFLLLQFLIKALTEEERRDYVSYLRAKGISRVRILFIHMFRNIFPLLFVQLRTTVWVILANIYLVEYIFNLNGFTNDLQKIIFHKGDVSSLIVCLLMLALPLLAIEAVGWLMIRQMKGREVSGL